MVPIFGRVLCAFKLWFGRVNKWPPFLSSVMRSAGSELVLPKQGTDRLLLLLCLTRRADMGLVERVLSPGAMKAGTPEAFVLSSPALPFPFLSYPTDNGWWNIKLHNGHKSFAKKDGRKERRKGKPRRAVTGQREDDRRSESANTQFS